MRCGRRPAAEKGTLRNLRGVVFYIHVGVMLHVCKLQEGFLLSWFNLTVCVFLCLVLRAGAAMIFSCVALRRETSFLGSRAVRLEKAPVYLVW